MNKLSESGLKLLKQLEGLRLRAYQCSAGKWTIGYGCTIMPSGFSVQKGDVLASERAADVLLEKTLVNFERVVNSVVTVHLNQNQYDAIICLCYNIGLCAFRRSTLLRLLNAGKKEEARLEFYKWKYVKGKVSESLRKRRIKEADLFVKH